MILSNRMKLIDPAPLDDMFAFGVDPAVISLACGNPDASLFPAEALKAAAAQAIGEDPVAALQYGKTNGYPPLLDLIRRRLREKQNISCGEGELLVTTGSQQGLEMLAKILVNEGDTVITEEPAFIGSLNAFRSAGATLLGVPMESDGMDLCALERMLTAHPETKFVYTISTSNNPTGISTSPEKRAAFYEIIKKHRVLVAEDDPYCELRFDGKILPPIKSMDTEGLVVYFGSFSKILAPGLRVGYVCADASIIRQLSTAKQTADLQTPALPQMMIVNYVQKNDLDAHVAQLRRCYAEKCGVLLDSIQRYFPVGVTVTEPDGGLFLWCDLHNGVDTNELVREALKEHVAFVPGYAFMTDLTEKQSALRLNFSALPAEKIEEGVRRLGALLRR